MNQKTIWGHHEGSNIFQPFLKLKLISKFDSVHSHKPHWKRLSQRVKLFPSRHNFEIFRSTHLHPTLVRCHRNPLFLWIVTGWNRQNQKANHLFLYHDTCSLTVMHEQDAWKQEFNQELQVPELDPLRCWNRFSGGLIPALRKLTGTLGNNSLLIKPVIKWEMGETE